VSYIISEIVNKIMACLEMWVRCHSRSLNVAPIDRSQTTSYQSAVVIVAMSCTIFELFDV